MKTQAIAYPDSKEQAQKIIDFLQRNFKLGKYSESSLNDSLYRNQRVAIVDEDSKPIFRGVLVSIDPDFRSGSIATIIIGHESIR